MKMSHFWYIANLIELSKLHSFDENRFNLWLWNVKEMSKKAFNSLKVLLSYQKMSNPMCLAWF